MRLVVNGETRDTEARTLAALWATETEHLAPPSRRGFAIALNGDVVQIIRAVAGG
jgi:sulfur carrier protein